MTEDRDRINKLELLLATMVKQEAREWMGGGWDLDPIPNEAAELLLTSTNPNIIQMVLKAKEMLKEDYKGDSW